MFRKLLLTSIISVFFLIFIGSLVRSTGAGMGCPDWPKCFGNVIPPSDVTQLPDNYIELYKEIRIQKNYRLEKLFNLLGLESVLHDKQLNHSTYEEVEFDVTKAWIEYFNRIVGVVVGFLVLGVFLSSFKYFKTKLWVVFLSFVSLIILLMEAFLGSIVVSTNLFPELISLHMLLALVLVFLLMYMYFKLYVFVNVTSKTPSIVWFMSVFVIVVSFIQMFLGIEVREVVDHVHNELNIYDGVISRLGVEFYIHRSFSIVLFLSNLYLLFLLGRFGMNNKWFRFVFSIIILEIFTGVTLANFDLPKICQPFHLLLGSLLIGMQFMNFLYVKFASRNS
jgi:heme a synthase